MLDRLSIENAIDGIHVLDLAGNVVDVNAAFCDMLGYSRKELLAMNVCEWDAEWNKEQLQAKIQSIVGRREIFETRHRRKDGAPINVEVAVSARSIEGKTLLFASARDITARTRAEADRRESEERFRIVVEQSIAGVYVIQDGLVKYANPRFAQIFGFTTTEQILGRPLEDFVIADERARVKRVIAGNLSGKLSNARCSLRVLRADGTETEIGTDGKASRYGGRRAFIGLLQDISERKKAEQQVRDYIAKLERALSGTVRVASVIGEMRDPYTAGHERRVGEIAVSIGTELELSESELDGLRVLGLLHDIGKINVPAEILAKPTRLSKIEFALVQLHPEQGHEVLKDVEFKWPIANAVLQHHERLDGSGYPHGLKGDQIIGEARILAVADTLEAMAAHRPYRAGLGIERALAEIEEGMDVKYDRDVGSACIRLFRNKRLALPQ